MKKKILGALMACSMLFAAGCGGGSGSGGNSGGQGKTLNPEDYVSTEKFITIADVPPHPVNELEDYVNLGFSGYILTEDHVKFTENGKITNGYKAALESLKNKGLDVYIRNQYNDPDYFVNSDTSPRTQFNAGGTSDPYVIPERNITTEFKDYPQVKGFYMSDEPDYNKLTRYGKIIDWYNTYYSDTYFHMNLLPSYANQQNFAGYGYSGYVKQFVSEIVEKVKGKKSICLDNYPYTLEQPGAVRSSYLSDILLIANTAKAYNDAAADADKAYMGICIQTFKSSTLADITCPAQVSFQLLTGMAVGSKMYEYFLYGSGMGMYGIMTNGEKRIYDHVKTANDKYLGFEKVLNSFDWQGLAAIGAENASDSENAETFEAISDITLKNTGVLSLKKSSSRLDMIVGAFKKGETDGYLAVNYSYPGAGKTNTAKLYFENCSSVLVYMGTEEGMKVEKVTLVDGILRLNLGAGEGAFVIPA